MNSQNLATNARNLPAGMEPDMPKETGKNGPSLAEIHERALEIHVERGGIGGYDLNEFLEDWLHAEHELRQQCTNGKDEGAKKK